MIPVPISLVLGEVSWTTETFSLKNFKEKKNRRNGNDNRRKWDGGINKTDSFFPLTPWKVDYVSLSEMNSFSFFSSYPDRML